jgi:hypothetical protein
MELVIMTMGDGKPALKTFQDIPQKQTAPDFKKPAILNGGRTLAFGDYQVNADVIVTPRGGPFVFSKEVDEALDQLPKPPENSD